LERWPNFFIVGAPKAGSTSLYSYLANTVGVYMSSVKEPNYFQGDDLEHGPRTVMRFEKSKYLKLFQEVKDEKAIGEASTRYLRDPNSAKFIHEFVPKAKIIILLRDPVERAFSHYLMQKGNGVEKKSLHEVITRKIESIKNGKEEPKTSIDAGLYTTSVKRYWDIFGKDNVKIIIFEEFIKNPRKTVKDVLDFLSVDAEPPKTIEKSFNPYGVPRGKLGEKLLQSKTIKKFSSQIIPQSLRWKLRQKVLLKKESKPKLSDEDRVMLENFYKNDVKNLKNLLKIEFPWDWINKIS